MTRVEELPFKKFRKYRGVGLAGIYNCKSIPSCPKEIDDNADTSTESRHSVRGVADL